MARKPKEVEVIDRGGAKTVARKTSYVTRVKQIFAVITIVWFALVVFVPLHVKNTYSQPIKKSIVVSMFFDLQRNIVEQYEKLLDGIKDAINLEKPVAYAIDKVKMAESAVDKVTDATAKASEQTAKAHDANAKAKETTAGIKGLTGIAGRFGINTGGIDSALDKVDASVDKADKAVAKADQAIAKVDDVAAKVNAQLDKVEKNLASVLQLEFDKMIDEAIKNQLDKSTGGLGTTLLTNYGIKHVYPWRPSSWPVATKIYNDLSKSDVTVITTLTKTVDKYFGYVAWGLVIAAWAVGVYIWMMVNKKVKLMIAPFQVCPRCGHTFVDRRGAMNFIKMLQPWKWF
ncbi:MAG: hypothetical protein K2M34_00925 [Alphaproteobacteria bacterium]|nr:hypothetical protein [Alphaproteobacteria bacterium]